MLRGGQELRILVAALNVGDEFVVRPGEKIATDGEVVAGPSTVDESLLTGESVPIEVGPGSAVTGGTVNASGRLQVRACRVGAYTRLAHMARLVQDAQCGKAKVQRLTDRVSAVFVPVVIMLAVAILGVAGRWCRCRDRNRRRRRGADHRVSLRPRPGHANGAAGRRRPRCAAGHPHQGTRSPGIHPASGYRAVFVVSNSLRLRGFRPLTPRPGNRSVRGDQRQIRTGREFRGRR